MIKVAGVFDPARIRSFDPLSQVPLGDYQPVAAAPATAASRRALHGSDLLPSQNLGGLVSQPVNLITTLAALPELENSHAYTGVRAADPISVIRVKVAGVTGPGALSRERINAVAQQIAQRTGLDVDIVAGSSPSPVTIDLPAGRFGQPPLTLSENWVKEGVAVAILSEVDKTSVALFTLILVVCVLFVGNAATAAVRGRRRELGVLAAVGWRRSRLFATVLGELAGIGLAAGLAGRGDRGADLGRPGPERLAGTGAAGGARRDRGGGRGRPGARPGLAARADPVSSVRPPVLPVRRAHQPRGDHLTRRAQRGPHPRPHPDRRGQPGRRHRRADDAGRGQLRLPRGGRRVTARQRRRRPGPGRRLHRRRRHGRPRRAGRRRRGVPEHHRTRRRARHHPQLRLARQRAGPAGDHRGRDHRRHRVAGRRRGSGSAPRPGSPGSCPPG